MTSTKRSGLPGGRGIAPAAALAALTTLGGSAAYAQTATTVTVNAGTALGAIPAAAFGTNEPVWNSDIFDAAVPPLLKQAGVNIVRFPGGTVSDMYHWQTNTVTPIVSGYLASSFSTYTAPQNTFTNLMTLVKAVGAQPMITVNYGTNAAGTGPGSPAEAAAWVTNANITNGYGIKYWEVGNEVYGNGFYNGSPWEPDLHLAATTGQQGAAALSPTSYGTNVLTYISDMKAVDPTIKVGVVLTAPGYWPDGVAPAWNPAVLTACGSKIDFVVVHWYPEAPLSAGAPGETDSSLLSSTSKIAAMVSTLKSEITQYCGTNAPNVQIFVTETNSVSYNPGKQSVSLVNGLFLADDMMTWLENGVGNVDWWSTLNSINAGATTANPSGGNVSASLYGTATYGDYGFLSAGTSPEPAVDTPFPPYYGYAMLPNLGHPGDTMVSSSSSSALVTSHAVKQANGNLALMLINKDPAASHTVNVSLAGYTPQSTATEYTYGEGSTAITSSSLTGIASTFSTTVQPYSLNTIVMAPPPVLTEQTTVPYTGPSGVNGSASADWIQYAVNTKIPVTATVTDTGGPLNNVDIVVNVFNSANVVVAVGQASNVNFAGYGASKECSFSWTPGATGIYTVAVWVTSSNFTTTYFSNMNTASLNVGTAAVWLNEDQVLTTPTGTVTVGGVSEPAYIWEDAINIIPDGYAVTGLTSTITIAAPSGGGLTPYGSECYPFIANCTNNGLTFNCTQTSALSGSAAWFTFSPEYLLGNTVVHPFSGDTYSLTYTSNGQTFTLNGVF